MRVCVCVCACEVFDRPEGGERLDKLGKGVSGSATRVEHSYLRSEVHLSWHENSYKRFCFCTAQI